jgi:hypothetical protein
MAKYNGHKNRNHWNVCLWINNDERLHKRAVHLVNTYLKDVAARKLLEELPAKTPDGAPVTFSAVRAALRGM